MTKFAVHYTSRSFGNTFIHIFAKDAAEAVQYVRENGIGYCNGTVYADRIVGVQALR